MGAMSQPEGFAQVSRVLKQSVYCYTSAKDSGY